MPGISAELEKFHQRMVDDGTLGKIATYLADPKVTNYTPMYDAIKAAKTDAVDRGLASARILVTGADGLVVVDTSKSDSVNIFTNVATKAINEKHMDRAAIMLATLSASGVGSEVKFSSSTGKVENYLAHRVGKSPNEVIGISRVSYAV
jgi:hypothetical protein